MTISQATVNRAGVDLRHLCGARYVVAGDVGAFKPIRVENSPSGLADFGYPSFASRRLRGRPCRSASSLRQQKPNERTEVLQIDVPARLFGDLKLDLIDAICPSDLSLGPGSCILARSAPPPKDHDCRA